jgi:hypothetical protein
MMASKRKNTPQYEELPVDTNNPVVGSSDDQPIEFDPDSVEGANSADVQVEDSPDSVDTFAVGPDVYAAQEELERLLNDSERYILNQALTASSYDSDENIVGTGIGLRTVSSDGPDVVLKVFVENKVTGGSVSSFGAVPTQINDIPVEVEEVDEIFPQMYNRRYARPVRCGVSIGHPNVTAGTLGCLVVLNNNRLCILSNNHVIANSNRAALRDPILQPGKADGGALPADRIGLLERFVPINFSGSGVNQVDAAAAWTAFSLVDPRHVTYTLNPTPTTARLGMAVKKCGRTTEHTIGIVTVVSANINVNYGIGIARFTNQIGIRGIWGRPFSRGGDSGSLIVTLATNQPVALLFAGNNVDTFANPIGSVMQALGIRRFL